MTAVATRTLADVDDDELDSIIFRGLNGSTAEMRRAQLNIFARFRGRDAFIIAARKFLMLPDDEAVAVFKGFKGKLERTGVTTAPVLLSAVRVMVRNVRQAKLTDIDLEGRLQWIGTAPSSGADPASTASLPVPPTPFEKVSIPTFSEAMLAIYKPPHTSVAYRSRVKSVLDVLSSTGWIKSTGDLTQTTIKRLRASWDGTEVQWRHFNNTLHSLCNIALERGWLPFNPIARTLPAAGSSTSKKGPVKRSNKGRIPTRSEVDRLLDHLCRQSSTWEGYRLYVLVALTAFMGLFRTEAIYLKWVDCDLEDWKINLNHGRRSPLVLPTHQALRPLMMEWSKRVGSALVVPGKDKVRPWTSVSGKSCPNYHIRKACLAIRIKGVTLGSLRGLGMSRRKGAPLIEPGDGHNVWIIMGEEMAPLVRAPHIRAVKKLVDAWSKGERVPLRKMGDDRKVLKEVMALHQRWAAIIDAPGTEGARGKGYGLIDPR